MIIFKKNKNVKIPVLMYHDFVIDIPKEDPYDFQYINTALCFEENIKELLNNNYIPISFIELYDSFFNDKRLPKKPIIITFDDGYIGQYTVAYPLLKKYNVKAAIFVTTDHVGKCIDNNTYFSWTAAKFMQKSKLVEICSHGKRHIAYDTVPLNEFKDDILESFSELNKNLGNIKINIFSYPFGIHNSEMVNLLKDNGINIQATGLGINTINDISLSEIKRINVPYKMTGKEIIKIINEL